MDIYQMLNKETKKHETFKQIIQRIKKEKLVLYGAGGIGYMTYQLLKENGCTVSYFLDDDEKRWRKKLENIPIISPKEGDKYQDALVLITAPFPMKIYRKLKEYGINHIEVLPLIMLERGFYDQEIIKKHKKEVVTTFESLEDNISKQVYLGLIEHRITRDFRCFEGIISDEQYFPEDIFSLSEEECFVDGGAYQGDTIEVFKNKTKGKYQWIYGFEPDPYNYHILEQNVGENTKIALYKAGLYSYDGWISFNNNGNSSSCISQTGKTTLRVVPLDGMSLPYPPTFIKMDIEGAEEEALIGMQEIIKNHKPKLAISIYHKKEDLWSLPHLIRQLNPSYKIYIRHYLPCLNETVCYAV